MADRVPVPVRARWRVSPGAALAAAAIALAVAGGAGARVIASSGQAPTIRIAPVGAAQPPDPAGTTPSAGAVQVTVPAGTGPVPAAPPVAGSPGAGLLVIDVVGQVIRPGIVRLPVGSRVVDALTAAGGPGPHAAVDQVNLARPLVDGEQIVIPRPGQALTGGGSGPGPAGTGQPGGQPGSAGAGPALDLNLATESQLDGLPGIGPVLAGRIVAWRVAHSRFSRVDELAEVGGIGDKLLLQLTPLVRV